MTDSKTMLIELINSLTSQVNQIEFREYYPEIQLQLPLNGKFVATVGMKSEEKTEHKQKIVYRLTLLSGVSTNGISMLEKANEIINVLLKYNNFDENIYFTSQCNTSDIEYLPADRCLRLYIDYSIVFDKGMSNISIDVNGVSSAGVLLCEQSSKNTIDIKVYGKSKPIDTLLQSREYNVTFKTTTNLVGNTVTLKYTLNNVTYKYNNCKVKSCNVYIDNNNIWYEYKASTTERIIE